jgi:hypothetical protein
MLKDRDAVEAAFTEAWSNDGARCLPRHDDPRFRQAQAMVSTASCKSCRVLAT